VISKRDFEIQGAGFPPFLSGSVEQSMELGRGCRAASPHSSRVYEG